MEKVSFKVSARAGKLLGRENFSNPEGAIIELVKNAYDADAKNCFVLFDIPFSIKKDKEGKDEKITSPEKGRIFIVDNGEGMTKKVIKDQWMKIGTGNKETDYISDERRVKTGAKGIGRFALDRLGFNTEMWTLSKKSKEKVGANWKMDWNQFDNSDKAISEINADLEEEEIDIVSNISNLFKENPKIKELFSGLEFQKGTILKISNLKDKWYDDEIANVYKSLEALIPPKELSIPFEVNFQHIQNRDPEKFGKVETAFFNDFDYKINAKYNADDLSVKFQIIRDELDIKLVKKKYSTLFKGNKAPFDLKTLENKKFKFSMPISEVLNWEVNEKNKRLLKNVGSFDLSFYYLKYTVSRKEDYPYKSIKTKERRTVLDKFGGVKIYRDSFRVRPYGDKGNDWLGLGSRRAKSPAGAGQRIGDWRVTPESTAGIITISRKTNPLLIDKADRGALQENDAFDTFTKIIVGVIHQFELDRSKIINIFYEFFKIEKEKAREDEINRRAKVLADKIIEEKKRAEKESQNNKSNENDSSREKSEYQERKTYEDAFRETFEAIEEERLKEDNEEIAQIRALASLGLIVSSFGHELKEIKNNSTEIVELEKLYTRLIPNSIKKSEIGKDDFEDGLDILELLKENGKKIRHWVDYSLTAIKVDKRKRKKVDLLKYLKKLSKSWNKIFKAKDIQFRILDKIKRIDYDLRAFEMDLDTIFTNLINNSIDSFNNLNVIQERIISISIEIKNNFLEIIYSDNGSGLSNVFKEKSEIFLPFTTSKKDRKGNEIGTGLGMYLVKNVIDDNGGEINILEPPKGFSISILLNIRKK